MEKTSDGASDERRNSTTRMDAQGYEGSLEAAGDYIRRGPPTDAERAQGEDGETARQIRLLHEWAVQAGRVISPEQLTGLAKISDRTSEHVVYFDPGQERAVKQTLPGQFGWMPKLENGRWTLGIAKPLDYLRRWQLFNKVFDDDVR